MVERLVFCKNLRLFNLTVTSPPWRNFSTVRKDSMLLPIIMEETMTRYRYINIDCHFTKHSLTFSARWNVQVASVRPKVTPPSWCGPRWFVHAVLYLLHFLPLICEYLYLSCSVEKKRAFPMELRQFFVLGWSFFPCYLLLIAYNTQCKISTSLLF